VLVLLMLAGALIRHSFVVRHKALASGQKVSWATAWVGTGLLLGLVVALRPAPAPAAPAAVSFQEVQAIVSQRCVMCHNAELQNKGVALHTPALIQQHAAAIYQQAVMAKAMPMNNATQITEAERAALGRWFLAGAPGVAATAP
jgi:uncharacterized membrane protein